MLPGRTSVISYPKLYLPPHDELASPSDPSDRKGELAHSLRWLIMVRKLVIGTISHMEDEY